MAVRSPGVKGPVMLSACSALTSEAENSISNLRVEGGWWKEVGKLGGGEGPHVGGRALLPAQAAAAD